MADNLISLEKMIHQYELIMKTTPNPITKQNALKTLADLKVRRRKLLENPDLLNNSDEAEINDNEEQKASVPKEEEYEYKILTESDIPRASKHCTDYEINLLKYLMDIFENEYWGVLSDYHLSLDYNKSFERDKFYPMLEHIKKSLKDYLQTIEDYEDASSAAYREKLQSIIVKSRRGLLVEMANFFRKVATFLQLLLDDYNNNGNLISNPNDILHFDKIEGKKKLEGEKIIKAVEHVHLFCIEALKKLNVPELR